MTKFDVPSVLWNMPQTLTDQQQAQGRNNIGAAALASLAASFESRAPSYVWSAGEVCTYGGALWQFDSDHSGAWTGVDAHIISVVQIIPKVNSLNLNDYEYEDLLNDVVYESGFSRRGTTEEFVRYYPDLSIVSFNLFVVKDHNEPTIPVATLNADWEPLISLTHNEFYFSDFVNADQKPTGVLGMFNSGMLTQGMCWNGNYVLSNNNIVTTTIGSSTKKVSMKNLIDPDGICYGAPISRSYAVTKK